MSLSCDCRSAGDGWWYEPDSSIDFIPLVATRRKRCYSCKQLIGINDLCLRFLRYRSPLTDIEERICGDEVELAPAYLCESCGEVYLNLSDIGYCYWMGDDLRENLREYWELTGFIPKDWV